MTLAFVCAPYRASSDWGVIQNIHHAESAAAELWRRGYAVICPHKNTAFFSGLVDEQRFLDGGLEMVLRCDVLFVCSDTITSGMRAEIEEAFANGIPVMVEQKQEGETWYRKITRDEYEKRIAS